MELSLYKKTPKCPKCDSKMRWIKDEVVSVITGKTKSLYECPSCLNLYQMVNQIDLKRAIEK